MIEGPRLTCIPPLRPEGPTHARQKQSTRRKYSVMKVYQNSRQMSMNCRRSGEFTEMFCQEPLPLLSKGVRRIRVARIVMRHDICSTMFLLFHRFHCNKFFPITDLRRDRLNVRGFRTRPQTLLESAQPSDLLVCQCVIFRQQLTQTFLPSYFGHIFRTNTHRFNHGKMITRFG